MYRDDREALQQRLDGTTREADRLRKENEAMRAAVGRIQPATVTTLTLPPSAVYKLVDIRRIPFEERARLAAHTLRPFPVWAIGVLNIVTLGLFPLIHFGLMHDKLPRAANNDPSAGKAIGFTFIPYFNFYWVFFNALRLCDRLTLQFKLRGLADAAPRGMLLAACIVGVIPYVNFLIGLPIIWTIAVCLLQSSVNQAAALSPTEWDATADTTTPQLAGPGPEVLVDAPLLLAQQARARRLVNASHVLGWGGLLMLLFGTMGAAVLVGGGAAVTVGVLSGASVIVGGVIGQIGRGMQGRAI